MKYLLDTCVLSELTKPEPASTVLEWMERIEESAVGITVLTVGELENGVERLAAGRRKTALRAWLDELREAYADRVLPVTTEIATQWGRLTTHSARAGKALPVIDALIGATALVHDLTVVTRNTSHLSRTGARLLNPWAA